MSILSSLGKSNVESDTDGLCHMVDDRADELRNVELGERFRIGSYGFRVVQSDRNSVYHVARDRDCNWYLKLPRDRNTDCIEREKLGLGAATHALKDDAGYRHPAIWRTSTENAYVLTAEVPGRSILTNFYRSLLSPLPWPGRRVTEEFARLGGCLARLHHEQVLVDLTQTRPLREVLLRECRQARQPDHLCEQVEQAAEDLRDEPATSKFAHGNLGLNNVLSFSGRITIIDFECSGRGSIYDDLSLVCGSLLYASAATHISTRRIHAAIDAFLCGYRENGNFDSSL